MAQKFVTPITIKQLSSAGSDGLTIYVDADSYARLQIQGGGRLVWGDGASAGDVNLYRDAADVLKTDDTLKVPALFIDGIEVDTSGATSAQVLSYNGTKFVPTAAAAGGSSVTVSDTAPVSPTAGDVWYESDTGILFVRYDSYWVEVGGDRGAVGAAGPGDALIANPLSQFAATTSAQLAGVISDETGTGSLVFSASPAFTGTPTLPTGTIATTQTASNNSTALATTAYVDTADALKANLASPTFTGTVTIPSGASITTPNMSRPVITAQGGTEGGEINLASPASGSTITSGVNIDVYANLLRIFEAGGAARGMSIDITTLGASAASLIATTDTTQTFTSKTLTSPVINTPTGIVKADVGLGNVDNTADTAKPVSTAQQTALNLKADLASPTFTGTPTLPTGTIATTQTAADSSTKVATTAFVTAGIAALVVDPMNNPKFSAIVLMDVGV